MARVRGAMRIACLSKLSYINVGQVKTLKGVAGNLGMEKIMNADVVVVEKLRSENYEGLEADVANLKEAYTQVMDVIMRIE